MDREEDLRLVPKKVEAAIRYRMRSHAMKQCESAADAYVQCTRERTFSIAWACRDVFRALKECTSHYNAMAVMDEVKRRWLRAGSPCPANWDELFENLPVPGPKTSHPAP